jgi:hypothetical protein
MRWTRKNRGAVRWLALPRKEDAMDTLTDLSQKSQMLVRDIMNGNHADAFHLNDSKHRRAMLELLAKRGIEAHFHYPYDGRIGLIAYLTNGFDGPSVNAYEESDIECEIGTYDTSETIDRPYVYADNLRDAVDLFTIEYYSAGMTWRALSEGKEI